MVGFALQDAYAAAVVPVLAAVTAYVEPVCGIHTDIQNCDKRLVKNKQTSQKIILCQLKVILGLIVRRSTDAVKFLIARRLLATLAVTAHKVL